MSKIVCVPSSRLLALKNSPASYFRIDAFANNSILIKSSQFKGV